MHDEVAKLLGTDALSEEVQLVRRQNKHDRDMLSQLVRRRREKFPIRRDFAESIGMDEQVVEDFELKPTEGSVRFIQMYALGLDAEIEHELTFPEDRQRYLGQSDHEVDLDDLLDLETWLPGKIESVNKNVRRNALVEGYEYA